VERSAVCPAALLHGFGDSPECWSPLLAALADSLDEELTVATPAAPGHAQEPLPEGAALDLPFLAEVAVGYLTPIVEEAGRRAVVGGHSMGAATAVAVAAMRPDLVAGLYLEDPPWSWPPGPESAEAKSAGTAELAHWIAGLQGSSHEDRVQWCLEHNPGWPMDEYDIWARAKAEVDPAVFGRPIDIGRFAWQPLVDAVQCPVTMLIGNWDRGSACMPQVADYVESLGWNFVRVPNAGHDVRRQDRPAAIKALTFALHAAEQPSA
jgi:pimeloyl-ACP methyl ester carboxylesterase